MADVRQVEKLGNDLAVILTDGSRVIAYGTGAGLWIANSSGGSGGGGTVPDSLTVTSNDGAATITLQKYQLQYALTILNVGEGLGISRKGIVIAFMTVFVESVWKMYANSTIPESLDYPHDAVGSDSDSLGLFQQRPSAGWGSVAELMDVEYNARAFFGGPDGPNYPSPAGLLDISGWESMGYGEAAQAVQVSAFPDRYDNWRNGAEAIYDALKDVRPSGQFVWPFIPEPSPAGDMPPTGHADAPGAEFGPRELTGRFHEGMDAAWNNMTNGADLHSAGAGRVYRNRWHNNYGNLMIIDHGQDADGNTLYTLYGHRQAIAGPGEGQSIDISQYIGKVGATGQVTGAHLHFETHVVPPGGSITNNINDPSAYRTAINPRDFMATYGGA